MSRTSAVGTWVLNESIAYIFGASFSVEGVVGIDGQLFLHSIRVNYDSTYFPIVCFCSNSTARIAVNSWFGWYWSADNNTVSTYGVPCMTTGALGTSARTTYELTENNRTITITGGDDVANADLIAWLEENATYVQSNIEVSMTSPDGVTLATEGKYVPANVKVTPTLQEKTVTVSGEVTPDDGYVGLSKVTVDVESSGGGGGITGGYTVTFMNGGITHAVLSVVAGGYINAPSRPEKEGSSFLGWVDSNGDGVEFPYYPTADVTLNANYTSTFILGFTGLTGSSGKLTLTDDVASYGTYSTATSGVYVSVSNPLDDVFPYNKIEEFEDSYGNVFVKFPKFYMKWVTDSNGVIDGWKISNAQADEDYFIPDAFLSPSGGYNDYFALGKYEMSGSSSKGYSKSGQTCYVNCTRANARSAARAYGDADNSYNGYQQEDIAMLTAYNFLCMMYYGTANIQTVYGGRTSSVSSWSSASVTGTCDGLDGMNGWNTSTDCVKMLGIENPFGNIYKWIDGIFFSGSTVYYQRYPQNFADSTANANTLGFSRPTSSGYVSALKHGTTDATKSGVYASAASGSASTYYGDYSWYNSSGTVLCVGGRWGNASGAGLWYLSGDYSVSSSYSDIGARLSYRPL